MNQSSQFITATLPRSISLAIYLYAGDATHLYEQQVNNYEVCTYNVVKLYFLIKGMSAVRTNKKRKKNHTYICKHLKIYYFICRHF